MDNTAKQEDLYTEEEYYAADLPVKTELIDWKIYYMSSPSVRHQRLVFKISFTIGEYIKQNGGKCEVFPAPTDVKLRDGVIVQPDIFVTCDPTRFDKQKHNGAPDWVIEITSPGNSEHDYNDKFWLYKENGVKEYWIIDPEKERVLVYLFGENKEIETYGFDETITAGLYNSADNPLTICIKAVEG